MKRIYLFLFVFTLPCFSSQLHAQDLLASYSARLSQDDHYSSKGQKLRSAAAIIRQDRANYHRFHIRDQEDKWDPFFSKIRNRSLMERWLRNGHMSSDTRNRILYGTPIIFVRIYGYDGVGEYIRVTVE